VDGRVDAVELRLDLYPDLDVDAFVRRSGKPVIASVRRKRDGGAFAGSEEERRRILSGAGRCAFIDLEEDADPSLAPEGPRRILSRHDLSGIPDPAGAPPLPEGAIRKWAVTPGSAAEAFRALDLGAIGMGEWGEFTRVLAPLTYCARIPLAPGMPTPGDLLDLFRARRAHPGIALFGVAGDPIAHSRSPAIHNPAFERDGVDGIYLRFRVPSLAGFWPAFLAHRGRGLSVTAPLKVEAAAIAREPDDDVRECGAANTLLADGRAMNTDLRAFLDLLPEEPSDALVLGAGGSARAALAALARLGHRPRVHARELRKARLLGFPVAERIEPAAIVINTTPQDPPRAPFVVDLRYGPGIPPPPGGVSGLRFLLAQARHQYRHFTGRALERGILLVGPRGAGKSTVGPLLARETGLPFLDVDREIERRSGVPVAGLLRDGRFRGLEGRTLGELLRDGPRVLAAGGGAVLWEGLRAASAGWIVVWLDADPDRLARRIASDPSERPPLTSLPPEEEIRRLREEREPLYRSVASFRVDTGRHEPRQVLSAIAEKLARVLRPGAPEAD
jgi:shikimate kinase/3-dehydroquinate dehydratase